MDELRIKQLYSELRQCDIAFNEAVGEEVDEICHRILAITMELDRLTKKLKTDKAQSEPEYKLSKFWNHPIIMWLSGEKGGGTDAITQEK